MKVPSGRIVIAPPLLESSISDFQDLHGSKGIKDDLKGSKAIYTCLKRLEGKGS